MAGFDIVNLDQYFDEIVQQREEGVPLDDIVDNLMKQYGIKTSERTLRRRCVQWGLASNVHRLGSLTVLLQTATTSNLSQTQNTPVEFFDIVWRFYIIDYDVDPPHRFFINITPWPANATL